MEQNTPRYNKHVFWNYFNTCFEISDHTNTVQRTLWQVVTKEMCTVRKFLTIFVVTVTKEKRVARRNIKI